MFTPKIVVRDAKGRYWTGTEWVDNRDYAEQFDAKMRLDKLYDAVFRLFLELVHAYGLRLELSDACIPG